jgi:predicted permease
MGNLRFALRNLTRTPVVSAVAILSLALGIGANTAIFSFFEQILLRPLPVSQPDQLVYFTANGPRNGSNSSNNAGGIDSIFSYPMYRDLERTQTAFTGIAAHRIQSFNLSYNGQSSNARGVLVSGSYFPVLGINPAAGRLLQPDDDKNAGEHRVVVLAHGYWKEKFNSDPAIIGGKLLVNSIPMTIIGVAPEGFRGTTFGESISIFVPISMRPTLVPGWQGFDQRNSYWVYVFARLKPGATFEQAQSSIHSTFINIIKEVDFPLNKDLSERGKKNFLEQKLTLHPGNRGQSSVTQEGTTPITLLFFITGFVLLIACANIANLLLARSAQRTREFSIRLSLGATRMQVIRQLLAESMLLALLAGLASLWVTYGTSAMVIGFLARGSGDVFDSSLNPTTLLFTLAISLLTGFLFGLFPAYHATRNELAGSMKDQAGNLSATGAASHFRRVLVTAQIALSLMLLISAGMFLRSLTNIMTLDLGLRTDNLIAFGVSPGLSQYTPERTRIFFEQAEQKLKALPGVDSAVVSMVPLLAGDNHGNNVSVDGFVPGPDTDTNSMLNAVSPGFFSTLGITVLKGREFTDSDVLNMPKVAIVNETFERKFGNGRSLLGARMQRGAGGKNDIEIVGVVRNAKYSSVKDEIPPIFYLPFRQQKNLGSAAILIASKLPPETLLPSVRRTIAEIDATLPLEDVKSLSAQVNENVDVDRLVSTLAGAFAGLATLLAAVGLYGVLAFTVARRTREIGIRLAIGADAGDVRNLVLREVVWMLAIGVAIGLPAAIALMRFAESLLFGVTSSDPVILTGSIVLLAAVSLFAGYVPARRAMQIEPLEALRYE